jgi:hypothetical protein
MEEFNELVNLICNNASSLEIRNNAERKLLEKLSIFDSWKLYFPFLFQANDTICFFICIGLQRLLWKYWDDYSADDKLLFTQTIIQLLKTRKDLQLFSKSKLEQVLGTICILTCSIKPVVEIIVEANNSDCYIGLSAIKTVFELIFSDDPKFIPSQQKILIISVQDIIIPLTNLACNSITIALQQLQQQQNQHIFTDQSLILLTTSLELLKIIFSKLPIGTHLTIEIITLLFTISEFGCDENSVVNSKQNASLVAIEILIEILNKKYLPVVVNKQEQQSPQQQQKFSNNEMLFEIFLKIVSLLKLFRFFFYLFICFYCTILFFYLLCFIFF